MKIHVLIVEDNPDQAELLRYTLAARTEVAFTSEIVATCAEAVERLKLGGINAVLLDLSLPDATGIDVIRRIAAVSTDVGIVVLTGWGGPEMARPAKEAGADELLTKSHAEPKDISLKLQSVVIHRKFDRDKHDIEAPLAEIGKIIMRSKELIERR